VVWQAASLLLAYPDEGQPGGLDMVRAAVNAPAENDRAPLLACADHLWTTPLITAAAEYSETFDWRPRRTPFLTYLFRPYIVYRSRDAARPGEPIGSRPRRRGW
jgi:nitrate reductase delta subunit